MKPITDPTFRYQPSYATDLRKTFARLKREQRAATIDRRGADVPIRSVRRPDNAVIQGVPPRAEVDEDGSMRRALAGD